MDREELHSESFIPRASFLHVAMSLRALNLKFPARALNGAERSETFYNH